MKSLKVPKEEIRIKGQKGKRSLKHYTGNLRLRNTNPTKNRGELMCFGRVSGSCSTSGSRCVVLQIR